MLSWRTAIAMTVSVSALSVGVAWKVRRQPKPALDEASEDREDVRRLEAKIARLEAASAWQGSVLANKVREAASAPPAVDAAVSSSDNGGAAPPRTVRPPTEAEFVAQLETKFQAEVRDPAWSEQAIATATRALANDLLPSGSRVESVDCRRNLCRVESSHDNMAAFKSFVESSLLSRQKKLWNGAFSAEVIAQSESGVQALTFITREGEPLPAGDPMPN